MISLKVSKSYIDVPIYTIDLYCRINIVMGDSGSGKTYFFNSLNNAIEGINPWEYECNTEVLAISTISSFKDTVKNKTNALIVIDETTVQNIRKQGLMNLIIESKNYFILLDRQTTVKCETNIKALFEINSTNIEGERIFTFNNIIKTEDRSESSFNDNIKYIVTEDTKSGMTFWSTLLTKLELVKYGEVDKLGNDVGGNGVVVDIIKHKIKDKNAYILLVLDYDQGATTLYKILSDPDIDKSKIILVNMESFEEVICNSEFILSKFPEMREYVINYKKHIDATYKHTGAYFSSLLFKFVKVKSPLKELGTRNCMKFYDKGMKNFKECFLDNCCAYNCGEDCKLFITDNKKDNLLCNKFKSLNQFR